MKQLHPRSVWLFFVSFLTRWVFVFLVLSFWLVAFFSSRAETVIISGGMFIGYAIIPFLIGILILIVGCFVWAKLTVHFYRYELVDNGFRKESGVIYKRYVTVPYERIQNVDIHRGILDRLLGLSDVHIQTAGASMVVGQGARGAGAEGRLPGVTKETAEQLRDELISRATRIKTSGV